MRICQLSPLPFLLAGCIADQGSFPSLAPRPIEAIDIAGEPAAAPVAPTVDPAQAAFAREEEARAKAGEQAFATVAAEAEPPIRAGAGQPAGSDRWTAAQVALSRLQAARAPVADALRALDERRLTSDDPALDAAFATVSATDTAQAARVSVLSALLSPE